MEKIFKQEDYINYGRWVQDVLSGCFWAHCNTADSTKLASGKTFTPVVFLDGHTLVHTSDQATLSELTKEICETDEKILSFIKNFEKIATETENRHLSLLDRNDLSLDEYVKELLVSYKEMTGVWWFGIPFTDELERYVKEKGLVKDSSEIENYVSSIRRTTWLEKQSQEIKGMAQYIKENHPGISLTNLTFKDIQNDQKFVEILNKHLEEYSWFGTHHWVGEVYDMNKCLKDIADQANKETHVQSKNDHVESNTKPIWHLVAMMMYWRTHCAEATAKVVFRSRDTLTEFAKKINLTYNELINLSFMEILEIIKNGGNSFTLPENFSDRYKAYGCYLDQGKEFLVTGVKLQTLLDTVIEKTNTDIKEFKGTIACKGPVVRGIAKIILSPKDFNRFQDGDILVAPETTPDFVPLMKMAKAIVTEAGGVTSHAAIVSRELKVPCITGTKIATQVVKDGDEIEVDTDNGIIRIIK